MAQTNQVEPVPSIPGLEQDPEGARIVHEELRLLETVRRTLAAAEASREAKTSRFAKDDELLLELRDDVATAKPEDLPALFEQMHHLGALRAQRGKGAVGQIDRDSPYFAHLRLEEKVTGPGRRESTRRRDVLIGSKSYVDAQAGIRIVDWRFAPVSRIYYRYVEGEDYEEPLGDQWVEGTVVARRSVAVVHGELARVASPQGTFVRGREGTWRRMASRESRLATEKRWEGDAQAAPKRLGIGADGALRQDKHLPAIAALLDEKQYDMISRPGAGLVLVQGSAGSGKTTVGLHRVAFLAFSEPRRFRPDAMMVVVPNEALVHYVGRVLPSLGVEGVPVTTFARWAWKAVGWLFPKLPTRVQEDTPPVAARAKNHSAMLRAIERVVSGIARWADGRVREVMARWPDGDRVVSAWDRLGVSLAAPDLRLTGLAQWLAGKRTIERVEPAATLPDVTRGAIERLGHELRAKTRDCVAVWDEVVTSRAGLEHAFAGVAGFGPGQLDQVHEWCVRQSRIRAEGERDGEQPTLDTEDHALLLRIWQVLRGPLVDLDGKPIRLAHLFVDEVQDTSPVGLRVLLDLAGAKDGAITLAGDTKQQLTDEGEEHGELSWDRLLEELAVPHTKLDPLQVSYRSTAEITTFARRVLGPLAHEAEPIATRHGPPVELFGFSSPGEAVAFIADALKQLARDEPEANVAIVARFPAQAELYYDGLERAEVPRVRRVRAQDFSWEPGVDVTDVRQTKGLEFDEVVLVETSAAAYPETSSARHALYVAATRASHQLWCVASDRPSPLVVTALEEGAAADAAR